MSVQNPEEPIEDSRLLCHACGTQHGARLITLLDGRVVGSQSEEYRRHCEAMYVLRKYRGKKNRVAYLDDVARLRGQRARQELRDEMYRIYNHKKGAK